MDDIRSNLTERQGESIHPVLISFLHGDARTLHAERAHGPAPDSWDEEPGDAERDARRPQPGEAPMQVLFVSLSSPAGTPVATVLAHIDPRCEITQITRLNRSMQPMAPAPSLALVDLDAYPAEGEAPVRELAAQRPGMPIIALSSSVDRCSIDRALAAGATGYLPRGYAPPLIEGVLRLVLAGEAYRPVGDSGAAKRGRPAKSGGAEAPSEHALSGLTPREREVLIEVARGCTNLEIANRLGMEEPTVKTHMHKIFRKLNVQNRAAAALCGVRMSDIQQSQIEEAERGKLNLSWLQPEMTHRRVRAGEWIFRLGDIGTELFYVQRGQVTLPEIGVTVGPGEVFGEIGIFTPERRRTCSARSDSEVDLFSLSSGQVRRIYFGNPQFALFILTLVATRLMADRQRAQT